MNNISTPTLEVGTQMPDFVLKDDQGTDIALKDLQGKRIVLYFYPKDNTPGCTTQACAIRDSWREFEKIDDLIIYGVSIDNEASHSKFRTKHDLPFNLLIDTDHKLADQLGFWVEKSMYGKKYMGMERSTVIIDKSGKIVSLARKIQPAKHVDWLRKELDL